MKKYIIALFKILPLGVLVGFLIFEVYTRSISKAGLGIGDKTLWDWMDLFIVPLALAGAVFLFNKFDKDRDRINNTDQRREDALQKYFYKVTEITRNSTKLSEGDITAIRILTLSTLRRLDGERKGLIVKFLFESDLITRNIADRVSNLNEGGGPIISLLGADLNDVQLEGATLYWDDFLTEPNRHMMGIDLSSTQLKNANFQKTILTGANLFEADLTNANFYKAKANMANFNSTILINCNLSSSDFAMTELKSAILINANCTNAYFSYADFLDTDYPNDGNPFTSKSTFRGANLRFAYFDSAKILPDQLDQAKIFWKTRLPSGKLYSRVHPLFVIEYGGNNMYKSLGNFANVTEGKCKCGENIPINVSTEQDNIDDFGKLKALWHEYSRHEKRALSKNLFSKLLYLATEFERPYLVRNEKIVAKIRDYLRYL